MLCQNPRNILHSSECNIDKATMDIRYTFAATEVWLIIILFLFNVCLIRY